MVYCNKVNQTLIDMMHTYKITKPFLRIWDLIQYKYSFINGCQWKKSIIMKMFCTVLQILLTMAILLMHLHTELCLCYSQHLVVAIL